MADSSPQHGTTGVGREGPLNRRGELWALRHSAHPTRCPGAPRSLRVDGPNTWAQVAACALGWAQAWRTGGRRTVASPENSRPAPTYSSPRRLLRSGRNGEPRAWVGQCGARPPPRAPDETLGGVSESEQFQGHRRSSE